MRGRYPDDLLVIAEHVEVIQEVLRDGHTEQRVARRARILMLRAQGLRVEEVAQRVERDTSTIWRVCERYRERGVDALYDAPRTGRPRVFSPSGAGAHRKPGL
jgi:Winged helix-turn helix